MSSPANKNKYIFPFVGLLIVLCAFGVSHLFAFASFSGVLPVPVGPPSTPTITLSSYALSVGQTATVTFTFPAAPSSFTSSDITASNGIISGFAVTGNPLVYTATFTPTASLNAPVNTISITAKNGMTTYGSTGHLPAPIAFDGVNMWVANENDNSVSKITPTGTITTYPGTGGSPNGIAFDGINMWTENNSDNSVSKITPSGTVTTFTGGGINSPSGIAFDGTNMWVANVGNSSVSKVTPSGSITNYPGTGSGTQGIAFDGTNMWVANAGSSSVSKITPGGSVTTYSGTGATPIAIAFDGTNMWTVNNTGNSVSKVTPSGTITTYSGTGNGPVAITFDGTNMWTANDGDNTVSKITPSGLITTTSISGTLQYGIAFDGANIWTANGGTNSVTELSFMSSATSANYAIDTRIKAPTVTTGTASLITPSTATIGGNISVTGGANASVEGINYGLSTSYDSLTSTNGSFGTGAFTENLTGLLCGHLYHYQAYATNTAGTGTGSDATFTTADCPIIIPSGPSRGAIAVIPVYPQGSESQPLSVTIVSQQDNVVTLALNVDSKTVKGYIIGLTPDIPSVTGIIPFTSNLVTYTIPDTNPQTIYLKYYSITGNWSPVLSVTTRMIPSGSVKTVTGSTDTQVSPFPFTRHLGQGMTDSDVKALQEFLNTHSFVLASTGPGTPGNETEYFGTKTLAAVIKFQESHTAEILSPLGLTKGTGYFGPYTLKTVNAIIGEVK